MPGELLKAAVWGSIWMPQGGLGTLEQIHPPFVFPPGVSPRLATNRTGAGPARQSSLYATPMERTSMIVAPKARSPWLPRRSRPDEFATTQKIRRESTEAGPAAADPPQSGSLTSKRRLPRALFRATVMSNPATPGFEKLKDTYGYS
jgi:hypothetical protein